MFTEVSIFQNHGAPVDGGRPRLNEQRLSPDEQSKVSQYLEAGATVLHTHARGIDILANDAPVVPATIRTDGEYVWTGAVTYYVQTYGVAPDEEFLAYLRARDYAVPTPTDAQISAAADFILGSDDESE